MESDEKKKLLLEARKALYEIADNEDNTRLYVFNRWKGSIALPKTSIDTRMLELDKDIREDIKRNHAV